MGPKVLVDLGETYISCYTGKTEPYLAPGRVCGVRDNKYLVHADHELGQWQLIEPEYVFWPPLTFINFPINVN
jgi:hypothetical protein